MENLIYPKPSEITFDLSGWKIGDTMFDRCSVMIPTIPTSQKNIDAPLFMEMQKSGDKLHVSFGVTVDGAFPGNEMRVYLGLFTFPLRSIQMTIPYAEAGVTWRGVVSPNKLADELKSGKLTLESICTYKPIVSRKPGIVSTGYINISIPSTAYGNLTCEMDLYPAPGVILKR